MKKIKKIIVPLLVVLCIPLFLAGCGSKEAFAASAQNKNGEIWYMLSGDTVDGILYVHDNNMTEYTIGNHKLSFFSNKSNSKILSEAKKISSSQSDSSAFGTYTAKLITDNKSKVLKEKICFKDSNDDEENCTLIDTQAHIKIGNKNYYGYNVKGDGERAKLVSNSGKQVAFDNDKTNNVEQVNQEND